MFVLPFSYSETEFLSQNIFSDNGLELQLFAHKVPNIPALIYYLIFNILGANITVIRATAAVFAIIGVFVVFKLGNFFFGKQAGIFSATILIVQNIFLAQFATVKPEMINAVLLISALYCFLREKYRTMCIWLVLAVNINISGILAILFLLTSFLIRRNNSNKSQSLVFFLIPIVTSATAELVNLIMYGELSVLKDFISNDFASKLIEETSFVFVLQQRLSIALIFVIAIITAALQHQIETFEIKNYVYAAVFMILIIISETAFDTDLCPLITAVMLLAIITGAAFASINIFYVYKYIIISILIICFAIFAARSRNISCEYISHTHQTETDLRAVRYITENISPNDTIMCSKSFYKMLNNKYLGYSTQNNNSTDTIYSATKYRYIIRGNEPNTKQINAALLDEKCILEKTFIKDNAETEIFSVD